MTNRKYNSSGMTIVEVLVSVIIISLVMGLLFTLLIQVQKASTDVKKKSSLLISQNVVTKAIEKDMIEVGVKAISSCTYDQFNLNNNLISLDEGSIYKCVRIEFNKSYDISDVGYILVYKQPKDGDDNENWVMRYGKGYYRDCEAGSEPENYALWKETYSVVQKIDPEIKLDLGSDTDKVSVKYTANYESFKKYSQQKKNNGNIFIPIKDDNGYSYNLDLSFSFRINLPTEETPTNPRQVFTCDEVGLDCVCVGDSSNCSLTRTGRSAYNYTCSESKEATGSVSGTDKSFTEIENVIDAKLTKTNIASVYFMDSSVEGFERPKDTMGPIDVSYSQNGTTALYYKANAANSNLYDVYIAQDGGVSVFGTSLSSMFKGFTNLSKVDFKGLKTSGITSMSSMFSGCTSLTTLDNFDKIDLSSVRDVSSMFSGCSSLTYSPFYGRTDLGNITNATSLFSEALINYSDTRNPAGKESTFIYSTSFPAYNVTSLKYFLKGSGIIEFDLTDTTLSNLKSMSSMFTSSTKLLTIDIENLNVPNLENMDNFLEGCTLLQNSTFRNIKSPSLTSLRSFFSSTSALKDIGFDKFDTSHVTDFTYMFYKANGFKGAVDISSIDFSSAKKMQSTFEAIDYVTTVKFSDDPNFNLDSVTDTSYMFHLCYRFYDFEGTKPSFRGTLNASHMFSCVYSSTGKTEHNTGFDGRFLHLENCKNFSSIFNSSGFSYIDLSGMHSKVEYSDDLTIYFSSAFSYCSNLKYVLLYDFDLKTKVSCNSMFFNSTNFTMSDYDISTEELTNSYLSGEGNLIYVKDDGTITGDKTQGKSPFYHFIIEPRCFDYQNVFRNCALLRGFPEGYLDDFMNNIGWALFNNAFNGAFSAPISNSLSISEDKYKEIYKLVLPMKYSTSFESSEYMFTNTYNLASVEFTKFDSAWYSPSYDHKSIFTNMGKKALENGRIKAFDLKLGNMINYNNGSKTNRDKAKLGAKWIFNGLNFKSYANNSGVLNIYLSSNCTTASRQYDYLSDSKLNINSHVYKVNYIGPDGCDIYTYK